ncbi:MAG TPA: hypothetical protein VLM42_12105, partial [Bryobacteraceae bacterium]|nr:hypothetical protein [Bryobacteraceae bacterium]
MKLLAPALILSAGLLLSVKSSPAKPDSIPAAEFAERTLNKGLRILPAGPDSIRAVPYLNITRAQIEE